MRRTHVDRCWVLQYLAEPRSRFWVVELFARGRVRRGATWRVAGWEEAAHAAAAVAQALTPARRSSSPMRC
jgi:hypothetical protein